MILLIIVGVAVFVLLVGAVATSPRESGEQRIRRQVLDADQQIQREYRDARRAMNITAGQEWRNLTD